jgi:hypothetical protein
MGDRPIQAGETFREDRLSGGSGLSKAFPSLEGPSYVSAADAVQTRPDDEVIGVVYKGRARAYPTWAARHYHIINDQWESEPLLIDT